MKIEVVAFEIEHADDILDRNVRLGGITPPDESEWNKWAVGWKNGGPAFTLIIDGEVVCSAGVMLMDWGRGEAWSLLSGAFYDYPKESYRAIRDGLRGIIRDHRLKRVQSVVLDGNGYKKRSNFLEHMGFEHEGYHRKSGPHGENMHIYALIME
jgi:hypothetical protein